MSVVKWIDTKPVTMISSIDNGDPENTVIVKRRKKGYEGKVDVKVPAMVQRYNKCMRGTDLLIRKQQCMLLTERAQVNTIADRFGIILTWVYQILS